MNQLNCINGRGQPKDWAGRRVHVTFSILIRWIISRILSTVSSCWGEKLTLTTYLKVTQRARNRWSALETHAKWTKNIKWLDICTISTYAMRQFNLRSTENYLRCLLFVYFWFCFGWFDTFGLRENRSNCAIQYILEYWNAPASPLLHHIRPICIFNCMRWKKTQRQIENS